MLNNKKEKIVLFSMIAVIIVMLVTMIVMIMTREDNEINTGNTEITEEVLNPDEIKEKATDEEQYSTPEVDENSNEEAWVPPSVEVDDFNYAEIYNMNVDNYKNITMTIEKKEIESIESHIRSLNPEYVEPDFEYLETEESQDTVIFNLYWYIKDDSGLEELFNENPDKYQEVVEDLYKRGVGGL